MIWIATGLSPDLTGIERFAISLARELLDRRVITADEITVHVDKTALWPTELADMGVRINAFSGARWKRPPNFFEETRLIHNLGGGLFPAASSGAGGPRRVYSVYDWGPFRDKSMSLKARLAWCGSIVRGVQEADAVHFLNPELAGSRPWPVKLPVRSVVAYSSSSVASVPPEWQTPPMDRPPYALFIGSAMARKRVDRIVEMAQQSGTHVVLVGQGTETYRGRPFVTAYGRLPDQRLVSLLDGCSALMLVSTYEGFGIPVLEAAVRGVRSVISHEVLSTLPPSLEPYVVVTDPEEPLEFAKAVEAAAIQRGQSRYEASNLLKPLVDLYSEVLVV